MNSIVPDEFKVKVSFEAESLNALRTALKETAVFIAFIIVLVIVVALLAQRTIKAI